jgi:hypothetical protein
VVEWISPFIIGIFVGFLVDPWLRAWIMRNDWARQERKLEAEIPSASDSKRISLRGQESSVDQPGDRTSDGVLRGDLA